MCGGGRGGGGMSVRSCGGEASEAVNELSFSFEAVKPTPSEAVKLGRASLCLFLFLLSGCPFSKESSLRHSCPGQEKHVHERKHDRKRVYLHWGTITPSRHYHATIAPLSRQSKHATQRPCCAAPLFNQRRQSQSVRASAHESVLHCLRTRASSIKR